jgi:hypothetical protein
MRRLALVVGAVLLLTAVPLTEAFAGPGLARWTKSDAYSGNFAVELQVRDGEERIVAVNLKANVAIEDIASLTFWTQLTDFTTGWDPVVVLGVDLNGDGKYRAKDFGWQFSFPPAYDAAMLRGDTFIQCEAAAGPGGPDQGWRQVDVLTGYACYNPAADGVGYGSHYGPLADYQSSAIDGIPSDAVVRTIKIVLGGSVNFERIRALVDLLELNGVTILDEPRNSKASFEGVRR